MRGRDLLTLQDFTREEIWEILKMTRRLKHESTPEESSRILAGKNVVMIFQKPSTRTRVSFEVAVRQLGGHALYLGWQQLQLGRGETIADTARVLDRYVDGIVARVFAQSDLEEMARHAKIPIINSLSDLYHPCQILCDLYTIWEKWGVLEGLKLAYVGDGNNVCNSLLIGCSKVGVNVSVACPDGYRPYDRAIQWALENMRQAGSKVEITTDSRRAVEKANVVYTDTFISMGMEVEREKRLRVFIPKYQVNMKLLGYTAEDAAFMHCLPAHREEEVTTDVIDGPKSIVWDQAENRLHTSKALLALIL